MSNDSLEMDAEDEQKLEMIHTHMTTFSMVTIDSPTVAYEKCRF